MEGPTMSLTLLGIEVDMVQQVSRLPDIMLTDHKVRVALMLQRRNVSLWELQEIVGHLHFACKVGSPGCTFLCGFAR